MRVEIREDLLVRPLLRHRLPRLLVGTGRLVDDLEGDRGDEGDERVACGDMDRIVGEFPRRGKGERILDRADVVGLEDERHAPRRLPAEDRHGAGGDLEKDRDALPRRRRIGDHDLRRVDDMREELTGHEPVARLAVDDLLPLRLAEDVLADEDVAGLLRRRDRHRLLVESDQWPARLECHRPAVERRRMLGRLKRQIDQCQRQHHLGEIPRGFGEVDRAEGEGGVTLGVVEPETPRADEIGVLDPDPQVAVVVLRPLLRRRQGPVESAETSGIVEPDKEERHVFAFRDFLFRLRLSLHSSKLVDVLVSATEATRHRPFPEFLRVRLRLPFLGQVAEASVDSLAASFLGAHLRGGSSGIARCGVAKAFTPPSQAASHASHTAPHRTVPGMIKKCQAVLADRRVDPERVFCIEGTGGDGGLEEHPPAFGIGGEQGELVGEMALGPRPFGGESIGKQNAFDRVELAVAPRLEIAGQVVLEEPVIEERPILLCPQPRQDHAPEECLILLEQEEIQFVAGMLRIEFFLLRLVELRPAEEK